MNFFDNFCPAQHASHMASKMTNLDDNRVACNIISESKMMNLDVFYVVSSYVCVEDRCNVVLALLPIYESHAHCFYFDYDLLDNLFKQISLNRKQISLNRKQKSLAIKHSQLLKFDNQWLSELAAKYDNPIIKKIDKCYMPGDIFAIAVANGSKNSMKFLRKLFPDCLNECAFYAAVKKGDNETMAEITKVITIDDEIKNNAIDLAAIGGNKDIFDYVMDYGYHNRAQLIDAQIMAAKHNNRAIFERIGIADPNLYIDDVMRNHCDDIIKCLESTYNSQYLARMAIANGRRDLFDKYFDKKKITNDSTFNAMFCAIIRGGYVTLAREFLAKYGKKMQLDEALMLQSAVDSRSNAMIKFVVGNVNVSINNMEPLYMFAAKTGCIGLMSFLDHYHSFDKKEALSCAINNDQLQVIKYLMVDCEILPQAICADSIKIVRHFAPKCTDSAADSFLLAAKCGSFKVLKYFIDANCFAIKTIKTAIKTSIIHNHEHIFRYLLTISVKSIVNTKEILALITLKKRARMLNLLKQIR